MGRVKEIADRVEDLYLDIYLIGYWKQGESILFVLKSTKPERKILYSGIIDSYKKGKRNYTIDLLNQIGIGEDRKLDFLCWTHPDKDHSVDINNLIEAYCDKSTRIVIPPTVTANRDKLSDLGKKICDIISTTVDGKANSKRYDICHATPGNIVKEVRISTASPYKENYCMQIFSLSPFAPITETHYNRKTIEHNQYSVSLLLQINELKLFLGSDIEDETIIRLADEYDMPTKFDYIKIPHHCSTGSLKLLDYLDVHNKSEIVCTTTYNASNLPDKEVLRKYGLYAHKIYCTSRKPNFGYKYIENFKNEIIPGTNKNSSVGIVQTQFDLSDLKRIKYNVRRDHDAVRLQ